MRQSRSVRCGPGSARSRRTGPAPWYDTVALLNAQRRDAALAAEQQRTASARVIRTAAQVDAAALAIEGAAALTGLIHTGWLILIVPMLLGALIIWSTETSQPARGQGSRFAAAVMIGIAAAWTSVVAVTGAAVVWAAPAVALAVIAAFAWPDAAQPAASNNETEEAPQWR